MRTLVCFCFYPLCGCFLFWHAAQQLFLFRKKPWMLDLLNYCLCGSFAVPCIGCIAFEISMRNDLMTGWRNSYETFDILDLHNRLKPISWSSFLCNELKMGLNNQLLYGFCFSASLFSSFPHQCKPYCNHPPPEFVSIDIATNSALPFWHIWAAQLDWP